MIRTLRQIAIGDHHQGRTRFSIKLEDQPSTMGTPDARMRLTAVLQALADQPALLSCGMGVAEKLAIYHNGQSWVVEAEATSDDATQSS